jgi:DNA-binding MarR family transcriptional regulator
LVQAKHSPPPKESHINPATRASAIDEVIAGYEQLMQRLSEGHAPDFLEIDITMPQAKVLYLLGAVGDLHMSELVARLGVSLSTVSGLVDRIVDHGLASRRDDPADRRQVVVGLTPSGRDFINRFRELNARQMRALASVLDDGEVELVRQAMAALGRAAARVQPAAPHPFAHPAAIATQRPTTTRKDPA